MPHLDFLSLAMLIYGNALIEAQKLTPNSAVQKDSKSYSSFLSIFSLGQCEILNHLELVMCHFSNLLCSICHKLFVLISSLKVCRGGKFSVAFFFFFSLQSCVHWGRNYPLCNSWIIWLNRFMLEKNSIRKIYLCVYSYAPRYKRGE